jgi:hypothetical protein
MNEVTSLPRGKKGIAAIGVPYSGDVFLPAFDA